MPPRHRFLISHRITLALVLLATAPAGLAQPLTITPLKPGGIYDVGEKIGWKITAATPPAAPLIYDLKKNGLKIYQEATLDLSSGAATIETSLDEPGAVLLEIHPAPAAGADAGRRGGGSGGNRTLAGALVAPQKLTPSSPKPADFDAFWDAQIKRLHAIPENPQVTPADGGKEGVDYFSVRLDNINDTHIYGQLAKPKTEGKFPALVILQWAGGPYPLQKPWVTARAAEGWLAFNIEPHDLPGDQPASYYTALPAEIKNFQTIGQNDKEKSYFLRMYLSAYRAIDYITEQPDWDGKTLVVMGTSMGGQQTLVMGGLHPKVTAIMACVPSSCDVTGPLHGRAAGFPDWARDAASKKDDQIAETGRYYDPVNFAPRVKIPALIAMGLIDETCPPTGAWTAINLMQGPVEALPLINSAHQETPRGHEQQPYQTHSAEWLATLVNGGSLTPNEAIAKPAAEAATP